MVGLVFLLLLAIICILVKTFSQSVAEEINLRKLHHEKVEAEEMNMYTNSEAHRLIMERIRIQDMELQPDFIPLQQKYRLEQWYNKVMKYGYDYFQSLNTIEAGMRSEDKKVVSLSEHARSTNQEIENRPE